MFTASMALHAVWQASYLVLSVVPSGFLLAGRDCPALFGS